MNAARLEHWAVSLRSPTDICGRLRTLTDTYEHPWTFVNACKHLWAFTDAYTDTYGHLQMLMDTCGNLRTPTNAYGRLWTPTGYRHLRKPTLFHVMLCCAMLFYAILCYSAMWFCTVEGHTNLRSSQAQATISHQTMRNKVATAGRRPPYSARWKATRSSHPRFPRPKP